jgi:hypothetical protein
MRIIIFLLIFLPGIFNVANGTMTPVEYQNTTMPRFSEYLQDEIPPAIIEDFIK